MHMGELYQYSKYLERKELTTVLCLTCFNLIFLYTKQNADAETIRIRYNPNTLQYADLLNMFFSFHTPENPSWCGKQYRSAIFTFSDDQHRLANAIVEEWGALGKFVAVEKASAFYKAEEYHQKYLEKW